MLRKVTIGLIILVLGLSLVGCGTSTSKTPQQKPGTDQTPTGNYLTPVPQGTPLVSANQDVSKQIMAQKDVLGSSIYEQNETVFGDITFKGEVTKDYAHNLANEFLSQLKTSYPGRQITTQVIIDGKTTDSISYKP